MVMVMVMVMGLLWLEAFPAVLLSVALALIQDRPLGYFMYISKTTPVVFALKKLLLIELYCMPYLGVSRKAPAIF
jgi:hypothetical protein